MGDAEEGAKQSDGVLHVQDDNEAPEGALENIRLAEVCGGGREGGGMVTLCYGLADAV